jgi:drug/metabolite transporter (DMT)-like permease
LAIAGQIVYQLGQRSVPQDAPPLVVLAVAYLAAAALCLVLAWPFGALAGGVSFRPALQWPTWVIALSIVAIEIGYLTAYRSGWTIGTAFTVASTVTVFALAVVGRFALGESLSLKQVLGLAFSCIALWLLSTGSRPA